MRHLLDGRALQDASSVRGIGTYARGLLSGLAEAGAAASLELLLSSGDRVPDELAAQGIRAARLTLPSLSRRLQPLADPFLVAGALSRLRPALYHGLEYGQPLRARMPVVITVHDLIPFVMPEAYPWMRRERLLGLRLLRRADAILADSASTARDVETLARVRPERITVVHPGVDGAFRPAPAGAVAATRDRHRLGGPYLLAVGTFDPRKRIGLLTEVVARLRRDHEVELVIVGDQGSFGPAVVAAVAGAGLTAHTRLLGHVPVDELLALYTGTACLLFTSAYEGFGLPPLEAMACGAPVAMFGNSSLPEVAGPAAILLPDGGAAAMAAAVAALLTDESERRRRSEGGPPWASGFTWARAARQTLAVYRSLTGERPEEGDH